jgi:hypothetical protein
MCDFQYSTIDIPNENIKKIQPIYTQEQPIYIQPPLYIHQPIYIIQYIYIPINYYYYY